MLDIESKDSFLVELTKEDPEYQKVVMCNITKKDDKKTTIADITKKLVNEEAVVFEDGRGISFAELLVARAQANALRNKDLSFRDLADMQKVMGESAESTSGVVINVITNGQDLGD